MSSTVVASGNLPIPSPGDHHDGHSGDRLQSNGQSLSANGPAKLASNGTPNGNIDSMLNPESSGPVSNYSNGESSQKVDQADSASDQKSNQSPVRDATNSTTDINPNQPEDHKPDTIDDRSVDQSMDNSTDNSVIPSPELSADQSTDHSVDHGADQSTDSSTHSDMQEVSTLQRRKPGPTPQIQVRPGVTVCQNCLTTTTPLWRRDENGQIMCNACGLFLKLHGRRRPISLKTDVIKSRNRSNRQNRPGTNVPQPKRRQVQTPMAVTTQHDVGKPQPVHPTSQNNQVPLQGQRSQPPTQAPQQQQPQQQHQPQSLHLPGHPGLPLGALPGIASMGAVPVVYPTSPALGPYMGGGGQGMIVNSPAMTPMSGPVLPTHHLGQQPLSPQVIAQSNGGPLPMAHRPGRGAMSEQLLPRSPESTDRIPHLAQVPVAQFQKSHDESHDDFNKDKTSSLMTRVSELELVNDLLRRRVQDLEASEAEARKQVEALKSALSKYEREQHTKRIKVSELL